MTTGYTAPIYDGKQITFQQFVMRCARGMMPLVSMRDCSLDAEIPQKLAPSDYHEKQITGAKAELAAAEAMTDVDADHAAAWEYEQEVRRRNEAILRRADLRGRYREMLSRVAAWQPPTPQHECLKQFMIGQLQDSEDNDCSDFVWPEPKRRTGAECRAERIENARADIARHERELAEEREHCDASNAWLAALRASLTNDAR